MRVVHAMESVQLPPVSAWLPWSLEGTKVTHVTTAEEAIVESGLDWEVKAIPLIGDHPEPLEGIEHFRSITKMAGMSVLSIRTVEYTPVQNYEAFAIADTMLEGGEVSFEYSGDLNNSKTIFLVAKIIGDPIEILPGDTMDFYLLLANSHDGSMALTIKFVKALHANRCVVAAGIGGRSTVKIRHSKNFHQRVEDSKNILGLSSAHAQNFAAKARALAQINFDDQDFEAFSKSVLYPRKSVPSDGDKVHADNLRLLYEEGPGQDLPGREGTAWGAMNAVASYMSWGKNTYMERTRFTLMGHGDLLNKRAGTYMNRLIKKTQTS